MEEIKNKRKKKRNTNEKNKQKEGITGIKKDKSSLKSQEGIARCANCVTVQFTCAFHRNEEMEVTFTVPWKCHFSCSSQTRIRVQAKHELPP
jgi:hypothetical protein